MTDLQASRAIAAEGMGTQSRRLRHLSENISNVDTPGFRRKMMEVRPTETGGVEPGRLWLDQSTLPQIFDPSHPMADDTGHYEGSNVDLIIEIADAREAQRSYEANLKMFDQARQMSTSLLELLRR